MIICAQRCAAMSLTSCGGLTVLKSIATMFRPLRLRISSIPSRAVRPPQLAVQTPGATDGSKTSVPQERIDLTSSCPWQDGHPKSLTLCDRRLK